MWLMLSNKLTYIQLNHLIEIHDIINMYVVVKFHNHNFTRLLIWNQNNLLTNPKWLFYAHEM